jgi:hypothetical protein
MNLSAGRLALVCVMLSGIPATAQQVEGGGRLGGGRIAFQYTGRVSIDFTTGNGTVYGYVTQFAGVPTASLFHGSPSESTALLTFQADISVQPIAGNGALGPNSFAVLPSSVAPGAFRLYFSESPGRQWSDPKSFATGTLVGTFRRDGEQFVLIGSIATNTTSAELESSAPFNVNGVEVHLRRLVRNGVTNITTANVAPLPGSTQAVPIFAFAGYALAIGN